MTLTKAIFTPQIPNSEAAHDPNIEVDRQLKYHAAALKTLKQTSNLTSDWRENPVMKEIEVENKQQQQQTHHVFAARQL